MAAQITHYVTGDAAFAVNRQGVIMCWNSAAEKTFSYTASQALGERCWELLSGQDTYGNRYCCEHCPLREMALQHEEVHSLQLSLRKASGEREKYKINGLSVFGNGGDELLLHICNSPDEAPEHSENNHAATRPSSNSQRGTLTNRELEALALLADGKTTREIASMMCISHATVRNHIQHMLYKLHVHNRLEAVVMGHRLDLV